MAAPLPTQLNWVHGPEVAQNYLAGAELGLQAETAQARLAEFAQRTQLEQQQLGMEQQKLGMMAEENKMKHLEAQQSLAIEKSYRDMQLAAQKRQLDMAGQLMQARTKQMADQFAAEEELKKNYATVQQQHPDWEPARVFGSAIFMNPIGLGKLPPGIMSAAANMPKQAFVPQEIKLKSGAEMIEEAPGKWVQRKQDAQDKMSPWDRMRLSEANKEIDKIEDDIRNRNLRGRRLEEKRKEEEQYKAIIRNVYQQNGRPIPPELGSSEPVARYDANGNFIPATAAKEEKKPGFMSDVWNAIKGTPARNPLVDNVMGRGEEAPEDQNIIPQAPVVPPAQVPSWPSQEQQAPQAFPAPTPQASAPAGVSAPAPSRSMIPTIQARAIKGMGKALRTPIGKSLADILEGIAGADDLSKLGSSDLQARIKELRDDILEVTK